MSRNLQALPKRTQEESKFIMRLAPLYEQDFYLWIRTTINQVQARQFERVDLENLLEELASMGRSEKRKIENLLIQLLVHLLKLTYWTGERARNEGHWKAEIINFIPSLSNVVLRSEGITKSQLASMIGCFGKSTR